MASPETTEPAGPPQPLDRHAALLLAWQKQQRQDALEQLLREARPLVENVAHQTLQTVGLADGPSIDDTVALVFDHLWRLPQAAVSATAQGNGHLGQLQRAVMPFSPRPGDATPGQRFLVWLTRRRAADIARRQRRRVGSFSQHSSEQLQRADAVAASQQVARDESQLLHDDRRGWLYDMLGHLSPADRLLMELILEGKTLAVIAHVLGCCEGTVCRRRQRIEEWLRESAPPLRGTQANTTVRRP